MPPSILHVPSTYTSTTKHMLIFFITGNPGLIGYYATFISTLNNLLPSTEENAFHIYGQSLPGFEDPTAAAAGASRALPYSLPEVIELTSEALRSQRITVGKRKGDTFDGIILIGHSVGSYIALELLRLSVASPAPVPIRAAVLLFPTVTHIAQSNSGIIFTTLLKIPQFPRRAGELTNWLLWTFPRDVVKWLVGVVAGMPEDAREVTMRFLEGKGAVWQSLHLAQHEMEMITEDRWEDEVWGAEHPGSTIKAPKLMFYFGKNDHWVANHTRDALIEKRGSKDVDDQTTYPKPTMTIDELGIPHSFSIKHSELVAEKVKVWIDEIIEGLEFAE